MPEKLCANSTTLSTDKSGKCLFHSEDLIFKKEKQHIKQFKELTKLLKWSIANKILEIDRMEFEGFIFTDENNDFEQNDIDDLPDNYKIIDLTEMKFGEYVFFIDVKFLSFTWFSYSNFIKSVTFNNCHFFEDADFSECKFEQKTSFVNCIFDGDAAFRGAYFHSYADFSGSRFSGNAQFYNTDFKSCAGFGSTRFSNAYFTETKFHKNINSGLISFKDADFRNYLRFERTLFEEEISFQGAKFNRAEFLDTEFNNKRQTDFDQIKVDETLIFKSLNPDKKLFQHTISLAILSDDINGSIVFENANVYYIKQQEIIRQMSSPSVRKIVIGHGCDKYRFKREAIIPFKTEFQPLIAELAQTFTEFFEWRGKIIIGINAECEFLKDSIIVRYYADTDLTDNQFDHVLAERVPEFIAFLKNPETYLITYAEQLKNSTNSNKLAVKDFDVYRKIKSLGIGLWAWISGGKSWTIDETQRFVEALSEKNNPKIVIELHQHFKQQDIFSIGSTKLLAGKDIKINLTETESE